jgi:TM2 domain-containing membrane protein YozV
MATEAAVKLAALPTRSPRLALLLSLLWPGLGQFYNGQVRKGAILAVLYATSLLLIIFASPLGFIMAALLLVYGGADAYRVAGYYERWISGPQKRCSHCGGSIQEDADSCRFCGRGGRSAAQESRRT